MILKRVVDNVAPQIEVLQKRNKLDPQNTIAYQRAIDFAETNQTVSETILNAIELVEKDSKKTEDGRKKDSSETVEKPKSTKAKKASKPTQLLKNLLKRKIRPMMYSICLVINRR